MEHAIWNTFTRLKRRVIGCIHSREPPHKSHMCPCLSALGPNTAQEGVHHVKMELNLWQHLKMMRDVFKWPFVHLSPWTGSNGDDSLQVKQVICGADTQLHIHNKNFSIDEMECSFVHVHMRTLECWWTLNEPCGVTRWTLVTHCSLERQSFHLLFARDCISIILCICVYMFAHLCIFRWKEETAKKTAPALSCESTDDWERASTIRHSRDNHINTVTHSEWVKRAKSCEECNHWSITTPCMAFPWSLSALCNVVTKVSFTESGDCMTHTWVNNQSHTLLCTLRKVWSDNIVVADTAAFHLSFIWQEQQNDRTISHGNVGVSEFSCVSSAQGSKCPLYASGRESARKDVHETTAERERVAHTLSRHESIYWLREREGADGGQRTLQSAPLLTLFFLPHLVSKLTVKWLWKYITIRG